LSVALLEQVQREIEVAVDDGDEQRARLVAAGHLVDVGACGKQ
jgi:hypothetical protein